MDDYSKHAPGQGGSVGEVTPQTVTFDEPFITQAGETLPRWHLCFETYGTLNAARNNAVLVCHALSGSQHAAGWHADNPDNIGWWDNFIGPDKPLDTNRFFILSPNNLGGCHGSSGPLCAHPDDGAPYGARFPQMTVEDWVHSQKRLAEHLGIEKFAAVVGGSLGGMQALRWAIDYPDCLDAAVVIAASARLTAQNIAFNDIARSAIAADPNFYDGDYYRHNAIPAGGLTVARMLGHVTYLSDSVMGKKFGRARRQRTQNARDIQFEVESYLRYQGDKFSKKFDANTYLLMTRALDYFDPAQDADADGDLAKAVSPARARFLLLSFSSDWRFPPAHSRDLMRALLAANKDASYLEIDADTGHDSFLLPNPHYHAAVAAFMRQLPAAAQAREAA